MVCGRERWILRASRKSRRTAVYGRMVAREGPFNKIDCISAVHAREGTEPPRAGAPRRRRRRLRAIIYIL